MSGHTASTVISMWPPSVTVDVLKPGPVRPLALAHNLSHIVRYHGATPWPFSVAQHSLLVCSLLDEPELRLAALLHDASEAVLGDLITPVKGTLGQYQDLEDRWQEAIAAQFGLTVLDFEGPVRAADRRAFELERMILRREVLDGVKSASPQEHLLWSILPAYGLQARHVWLKTLDLCLRACGQGGLKEPPPPFDG